MFLKRLAGRAAEAEGARGKRDGSFRIPNRGLVTAPLGDTLGGGGLPLQGRRARRRAECVWGERSPRAAGAGSGGGDGHLSGLTRDLDAGGSAAQKSDCHAGASLVSIPVRHGTRLGPIGVSPNIVVTIAALGDPCLQS
jgi:hypothetical protein